MGHTQSKHPNTNPYLNSMYSNSSRAYGNYGNGSRSANNNNISCIIAPINGIGGLYLGDIRAAEDLQMLQRLGIKAVLTAAQQADLHYDHSIVPYHLIINANDTSQFNLSQYFDQAVSFTKQCLSSTNVLIHCMAGVSRSTTLVIAYLMYEKGVGSQQALAYIRQCRPFVNPNSGFIRQLKEYEMILSQRMMSSSNMMMSGARPFSLRNLDAVNGKGKMDYYGMNQFRVSGVRERQNYY